MLASDILTQYVAPGVGVVTAIAIFVSPMKDVHGVVKSGDLGSYNPLPAAFTFVNCLGWALYSFLVRDWFVFAANFLGALLGLYYSFQLVGVGPMGMSALIRRQMLGVLMCGTFVMLLGFSMVNILVLPQETAKNVAGIICDVVTILWYISPLSTIVSVLRTRDASSFSLPFSLTCTVNALLWLVYGLFTFSPFIWVPNSIGSLIGILQIVLSAMFGRSKERKCRGNDVETVETVESQKQMRLIP
ncbi:hypothetical protein M427DRAFT_201379 [Gonapodya prolifera JEL478]|uniref:Sugar transporter SWEET1 n=1 Tax=Gonapodya prolifera (strain JEL478) TaxID=1344416 RepID=A0A138ZZX7_GONPJ|nr:hypothetical protein M427DRAFT_201379 [Gonapodya prolifera JEL478]|eukprot:KXS09968.1 hypothetical protein M427DRAFT_201379 [Gonapodya prolifera JEL478]